MPSPGSKNKPCKDGERQQTVVIMPETSGDLICLRLEGEICLDDYMKHARAPIENSVNKNGHFRLLLLYGENYKGWSEASASASFEAIREFGKYAVRQAYVNPPQQKMFQMKVSKPLFGGEFKFFDNYQEALRWVKAD